LRTNLAQVVLRHVEHHRDRLELRDHYERRSCAGKNGVAGIHQPQTNAAGDRRSDVAIGKLHQVVSNRRLVGLHSAFVLKNDFFLILELLPRDRVSFERGAISLQVHARLRKYVLIAVEGSLRLAEQCFVRPGINVDERVTFVHDLAFPVVHVKHLARDLGKQRDRANWSHGAEGINVDVDVSNSRSGNCNRGASLWPSRLSRGCVFFGNSPEVINNQADQDDKYEKC